MRTGIFATGTAEAAQPGAYEVTAHLEAHYAPVKPVRVEHELSPITVTVAAD